MSLSQDTRTHVVGELYDTERSYVESLQILVEKYMKPLKSLDSNRILIDSNLVDEIFYTIPEILQHHETFLSALQDRLTSDWDTSQVIGNVFIEAFTNQQIIDTYTAFINNWKNARQAIKIATQAKPAFEKYLEAMSREHRNKLTLDALLIMPVQRIPRYELLIKELIKHTPDEHPDYGLLIEAQKEIHELALKIDRAEKEMIHQEQLRDLESLIEGHVELQHHQREFIRYDLVTILGASALTVAKKERVLFLFCDLLIMTSVKKKASRRSNLQTAFVNSSNDLTLLEGNKFKLLLRVSLDQVEVRLGNDEIQHQEQQRQEQQHQEQQHQEQQHQFQLQQQQQQNRLIHERIREIEADLHILHQMESLTSKMILSDKTQLSEVISALIRQLKQRLHSFERNDLNQPFDGIHQGQEVYAIQPPTSTTGNALSMGPCNTAGQSSASPISQSSANYNQYQQIQGFSTPSSQLTSNTSNNMACQQDSNTSLEFIISNSNTSNNPAKDPLNTHLSSSSATSDSIISNDQTTTEGQTLNCDTLVVTFASNERRQAFLQAFIEAKQQRYILQHQRVFSSSATIRLAQPNSPDKRLVCSDGRQHQDNVENRLIPTMIAPGLTSSGSNNVLSSKQQGTLTSTTARISSAPLNQSTTGATIIHQMSAPQSLALDARSASPIEDTSELTSYCTGWSSNVGLENISRNQRHHLHHHHQLMHQPASHPASLDTICCNELHNDTCDQMPVKQPVKRLDKFDESVIETAHLIDEKDDSQHCTDYYQHMKELQEHEAQIGSSSIVILDTDDVFSNTNLLPAMKSHRQQLMSLTSQNLLFKSAPTFLEILPMNFLNTQHPALQFTCSTLKQTSVNANACEIAQLREMRRQTVKDNTGQLWLCMSNGYVSHVALISVRKRWLKNDTSNSKGLDYCSETNASQRRYNIIPVVQSAGDICKSHVNCAIQVKWFKEYTRQRIDNSNTDSYTEGDVASKVSDAINSTDKIKTNKPQVEVEIKSASPPVDIKSRPASMNMQTKENQLRLSESAPSARDNIENEKSKMFTSSVSTTRLEVPSSTGTSVEPTKMSKSELHSAIISHESKRPQHDAICHRHYHHNHKLLPNRLSTSTPNQQRNLQLQTNPNNHQHLHHHHHHHHQHISNNRVVPSACHRLVHNHHHHSHHHHHHHHLYTSRHNTVPIVELRKALERQNKLNDYHQPAGICTQSTHLVPPANTPTDPLAVSADQQHASPSESTDITPKKARSITPPASKSFRSARMLRHQASLKTSSILAKLVGGASKHSSYLRKATLASDKQSDVDDNDTDTESGNITVKQANGKQHDYNLLLDGSMLAQSRQHSARRSFLNATQTDLINPIISPLSSVSSLNSTNSSITVNSVCASSPNRSSCNLLVHSLSATCCAGSMLNQIQPTSNLQSACSPLTPSDCGIRSRSATVPSRALCEGISIGENTTCPSTTEACKQQSKQQASDQAYDNDAYKVSEIISDFKDLDSNPNPEEPKVERELKSSLWLGCDDGSIIIIDCLNEYLEQSGNCNLCDLNQKNLNCSNQHSEIKLSAPVSDIKVHKDRTVFVALSNGQLAIFSRNIENQECAQSVVDIWSLTNPKILTVTTNELNSTSKLCLIDDEYLWYSYGRNIFVLNITTLKLETTIMAPTNDLSLQFTLQSITIENMELMSNLFGVWISFKNSHSIQLYDVRRYKLIVEINLFEPINKMLSYGNEIIRQHKTACLKATSFLNVNNQHEQYNTLFIGTSSGVILYLNISHKHLTKKEGEDEPSITDWIPHIACLRHGHSGHVKFLHLIEAEEDPLETEQQQVSEALVDTNNNATTMPAPEEIKGLLLVSGGTGIDFYGPNDDQQIGPQLNSDEDNLNHLMFWQL